jgi:hypothetical protein
MLIHGTRPGVHARPDNSAEQYVPGHTSGTTATDLGLDDDRPRLLTRLSDENSQGIPTADFEAGRGPRHLARRKPHLGVLRRRIDDEHLLGPPRN